MLLRKRHGAAAERLRTAVELDDRNAAAWADLGLALAVPTGYVLARWRFPGRWLLDALVLIPVIMSPMASGLVGSPSRQASHVSPRAAAH